MNQLTSYALKLSQQGFKVFPLQANSKRPVTAHGYLDATDNVVQIGEWFDNDQHYNIGLQLTGTGIVVIDIDQHGHGNGIEVLKNWQHKGMQLIPAYVEKTPHKGLHYFFKTNQKLADKVIVPSVELKTKQIMIAPSQLDGKGYQVIKGQLFNGLTELPHWLLTVINGQSALTATVNNQGSNTWTGQLLESVFEPQANEGSRNVYLTSLCGRLLHTRTNSSVAYEALMMANERLPSPLPEKEVNTIFKSVLKRELGKRGEAVGG